MKNIHHTSPEVNLIVISQTMDAELLDDFGGAFMNEDFDATGDFFPVLFFYNFIFADTWHMWFCDFFKS